MNYRSRLIEGAFFDALNKLEMCFMDAVIPTQTKNPVHTKKNK